MSTKSAEIRKQAHEHVRRTGKAVLLISSDGNHIKVIPSKATTVKRPK